MKIYLVLHHEIMGRPPKHWADEMVFHTASSMRKALDLIRRSYVDSWSWWEIQVCVLDELEWPKHVGYYGPRGGKLKRPPREKCVERFLQAKPWKGPSKKPS